MLRTTSYLKDGISYGPFEYNQPLAKILDVVIQCELQWGATFIDGDVLEYRAKVMGREEITRVSGTKEEVDFVRQVTRAYLAGRTIGVKRYLLNLMGQPMLEGYEYNLDDILELLDLHLIGEDITPLMDDVAKLKEPIDVKATIDAHIKARQEIRRVNDTMRLSNDEQTNNLLISSLANFFIARGI